MSWVHPSARRYPLSRASVTPPANRIVRAHPALVALPRGIVNYYGVFTRTPNFPTYPGPIGTKLPCNDDSLDQIRIVRDYGVDKILSYAELETAVENIAAPPLWHRIGEPKSGEPCPV
jgi:hypothetical protein